MTRIITARQGKITEEIEESAKEEHIDTEILRQSIADGTVVLIRNTNHKNAKLVAIGKNLKTKVNANIGTSMDYCNIKEELKKVEVAIEAGTDTIMDLSTGGDLDLIRKMIIEHSTVPVGTVPIYQAVVEILREGKTIPDLDESKILDVIRRHLESGVDFITVHCGLLLRAVKRMENTGRIMNVVSRGGSFLVNWMRVHNQENPFYTYYDRILEIAKEFDVTLSLGDGLRPGCIHDSTDGLQVDELLVHGELRDRAVEAGVQVMVEGPGHIPLSEISANVLMEKRICKGAPFYVLGPLPTDIAPGYDHITSAIGGAIAASAGADFLCFVTPSEHLRLPIIEDIREGVIATRIAAHIGDIEKGYPQASERDDSMAYARQERNWERMFTLSIDPVRAKEFYHSRPAHSQDACTMCGDLCSMKLSSQKQNIK